MAIPARPYLRARAHYTQTAEYPRLLELERLCFENGWCEALAWYAWEWDHSGPRLGRVAPSSVEALQGALAAEKVQGLIDRFAKADRDHGRIGLNSRHRGIRSWAIGEPCPCGCEIKRPVPPLNVGGGPGWRVISAQVEELREREVL